MTYTSVPIPKYYLFADDFALFFSSDTLTGVEHAINKKLPQIFYWLCSNRLNLNTTKTFYQIYSVNENKLNTSIYTNNTPLNRSAAVKYLGVDLDANLI